MVKNRFLFALFTLLLTTAYALSANAGSQQAIEDILSLQEAPTGVVFEVVSGDEAYLKTALEDFETYREQLQTRFPDIQFAVVTHGSEQFALTRANQPTYQETHGLVKRIVADSVPVHVCGTHASWRDVTEEDFPDYVTVSASGPAAIRDYEALGYLLVIL